MKSLEKSPDLSGECDYDYKIEIENGKLIGEERHCIDLHSAPIPVILTLSVTKVQCFFDYSTHTNLQKYKSLLLCILIVVCLSKWPIK